MSDTTYPKLDLTPDETETITESFDKIREVLKRRNIDIQNVIGLVTTDQIERTREQVEIRFAEKTTMNVVMNMVAFD